MIIRFSVTGILIIEIHRHIIKKSIFQSLHTCLLVKFNGLGGGFPRVDIFTVSTGVPSGKLQMSKIIFPLRELRDSGLCFESVLKSFSVLTKFGTGLLGELGPMFKSTPGAVSISVGQFFLIGDVWLDEHDSGFT